MTTKVYIAISSTSRTGDLVAGGDGAIYSATYSTFALAEADATYGARDLVTLDEQAIYYLFEDQTTYITPVSAAWSTSPSTNIIIDVEPSYRHTGGVWNSGFKCTMARGYNCLVGASSGLHVTFKNIQAENTHSYGAAFYLRSNTILENCLGKGGASEAAFATAHKTCIAKGCSAHGGYKGFFVGNYDDVLLYNCVAVNCGTGFYYETLGITGAIINCAAFGNTTDFNTVPAITKSHNASSDATAPGTSSLINQTDTDCFESPSAYDYHLKAGSPLAGAGYDLSGINTHDIDGQPWVFPYSIGFDQPGTFVVPVAVTIKDAETLSPIQDVDVYLKATSGGPQVVGSEVTAGTTDVNGEVNLEVEYVGDQPFIGQGRKGTSTPFYQEGVFAGIVGNEGYSSTVYIISDED